jgi:elongator complex protein 3
MLEFGCTRVELGVQAPDDKIYKKVKRGHTVQEVVDATSRLRNAGFKIGYHIMPGIPGSNLKKDIIMFKKLFKDNRFKPDQLKIYPCQVICGAELEGLYWKNQYKPYSEKELHNVILKMMKLTPRYCRIMRIMREIPPEFLVAGTLRINLRKDINEELRKKEKQQNQIKEIRFREIGMITRIPATKINQNLKLKTTKYKASKGDEYFLEFTNKNDILFALLRLRTYNKQGKKNAIIRELHVYGKSIELKNKSIKKSKTSVQHKGLGKKLLKKAEQIVKKNNIKKLKIISGVGVREYYKKLGYKLNKQSYMEKEIIK